MAVPDTSPATAGVVSREGSPMRQLRALIVAVALLATGPAGALAQSQAEEEAAIKKVVETMARSINKDDLNTLLAQLADDAKIYTRVERQQVSKVRYGEIMANVFKSGSLVSVEVRDLTVTMMDPTHAMLIGTTFLVMKTDRASGRAEYKLEKRDGRLAHRRD
jgi:ketosteroid isomerase-like protein